MQALNYSEQLLRLKEVFADSDVSQIDLANEIVSFSITGGVPIVTFIEKNISAIVKRFDEHSLNWLVTHAPSKVKVAAVTAACAVDTIAGEDDLLVSPAVIVNAITRITDLPNFLNIIKTLLNWGTFDLQILTLLCWAAHPLFSVSQVMEIVSSMASASVTSNSDPVYIEFDTEYMEPLLVVYQGYLDTGIIPEASGSEDTFNQAVEWYIRSQPHGLPPELES